MSDRLNELGAEIVRNLDESESTANESKWNRALLYKEARSFFKSNNAFGDWLNRLTGAGKTDSSNVVSKMISFTELLNRDIFLRCGFTICQELVVKTAWKNFPEEMAELTEKAHNMSFRQVREAVREIQNKPTSTKSSNSSSLKTELEMLRIKVQILEGNYRYSEEEFFHPVEPYRSMQIKQLNREDDKSVLNLFGLSEVYTKEEVDSSFRRISRNYHPDRGGSNEMFQFVSSLKELLINLLKLRK